MKLKYISIIAILAAVAGCARETGTDYSAKVNPFAGTGGHGHVFVGANVPYGMVQLGPQQIKDAWDWCSGYHYSDTLVIGFGHTHLSGTGIGDLGDIVFLPYNPNGKVLTNTTFIPHKGCDVNHIYAHLDHSLETLAPGFYSVKLPDYGVEVSLTATERAGFHKYVFTSDESAILVDLCSGINWDDVTDYGLDIVSDTAIEGFRR
ncbi:MAG: glycoside hydrolase family 92 protein, partial [Candidatus Cryptobacteroides sp.]